MTRALVFACLALLAGCSASLLPRPPPGPALYAIDPPAVLPRPTARPGAPTLLITVPRAAPGHDGRLIAYQRQAHRLEYYAASEWVDTPARLLAPLMLRAAEATGAFRAVLAAPGGAAAGLRLDTELVRLQQDFNGPPSRMRLTLRAVLVDTATHQVLATREFDASAPAPSEDAAGGVAATQQVAGQVMQDLAAFCAAAAAPDGVPKFSIGHE